VLVHHLTLSVLSSRSLAEVHMLKLVHERLRLLRGSRIVALCEIVGVFI